MSQQAINQKYNIGKKYDEPKPGIVKLRSKCKEGQQGYVIYLLLMLLYDFIFKL